MDIGQESLCFLIQMYRDKALNTFVRGLKGGLPKLHGMTEPVDLPKAIHLCMKLENQHFRSNYANNVQSRQNYFRAFPSKLLVNMSRQFFPEPVHIQPPWR